MLNDIIENETLPVNIETNAPTGISHGFDTGYAIAYGVEEAIMIRNFQHFIIANANRGHNFHEGRFWTYDRLADFPGHFPYWTIKQIRRILDSLVKQGVIIKGEFNQNWSMRTQWYAFKDQDKFIKNIIVPKTPLPIPSDLPKKETVKCPNGQMADDEMGICINDTTTITDTIYYTSLKVPMEPVAAKAARGENNFPSNFKSKREKPDFTPEVRDVANKMVNALVDANPDWLVPKNLQPMLSEIAKMINEQKRDPVRILKVFNWAINDEFWLDKISKPNPAKYLNEKFSQFAAKMDVKPKSPKKERKFAPCSDHEAAMEAMRKMNERAL